LSQRVGQTRLCEQLGMDGGGRCGKGHALTPSESVLPFLVRRGFHPKLGARPMRDAIEKLVGDAVSTDLLTGGKACGQLVVEENGCFLSVRK
jgi:ATP-dependent Clp protease ATP-binding subunit ClpA